MQPPTIALLLLGLESAAIVMCMGGYIVWMRQVYEAGLPETIAIANLAFCSLLRLVILLIVSFSAHFVLSSVARNRPQRSAGTSIAVW